MTKTSDSVIKNIFNTLYRGSINRQHWWVGLLIIGLYMILFSKFISQVNHDVGGFLLLFIAVAAKASIDIRRLHDLNKSGWWFLVFQIPGINIAGLFVLGLMPSKKV